MIDYSRLDRNCSCLVIDESNDGPGTYTSWSCKLDKFSETNDCIGCQFCSMDIPGTTQSRVMAQLAELGF